jgi:hypothetical protein
MHFEAGANLPPADDSVSLSSFGGEGWGENPPDNLGAPCAPELGKDAFHRVPDFARNEWDAVERVLTTSEDRFRGREKLPVAVSSCPLKAVCGGNLIAGAFQLGFSGQPE